MPSSFFSEYLNRTRPVESLSVRLWRFGVAPVGDELASSFMHTSDKHFNAPVLGAASFHSVETNCDTTKNGDVLMLSRGLVPLRFLREHLDLDFMRNDGYKVMRISFADGLKAKLKL